MPKVFFIFASSFGFLAVALGAFGAHGLKPILSPREFEIFQTAVHYQFIHALALLSLSFFLMNQANEKLQKFQSAISKVGWFWIFGVLIFSGSLYALVGTGIKVLGAVTPIGGTSFLIGWGILIWQGVKTLPDVSK